MFKPVLFSLAGFTITLRKKHLQQKSQEFENNNLLFPHFNPIKLNFLDHLLYESNPVALSLPPVIPKFLSSIRSLE